MEDFDTDLCFGVVAVDLKSDLCLGEVAVDLKSDLCFGEVAVDLKSDLCFGEDAVLVGFVQGCPCGYTWIYLNIYLDLHVLNPNLPLCSPRSDGNCKVLDRLGCMPSNSGFFSMATEKICIDFVVKLHLSVFYKKKVAICCHSCILDTFKH